MSGSRCKTIAAVMVVLLAACKSGGDTVLTPDPMGIAAGGGRQVGGTGAAGAGTNGSSNSGTGGGSGSGSGVFAGTGAAGTSTGASGAAAGGGAEAGMGGKNAEAGAGQAGGGGMAAPAGTGGGTAGVMATAGTGGTAGGNAMANDPMCDFTGIWIGKQVTVSEAIGLPQSSNNWYYLEFTQAGTAVQVSKHFDCGIEVRGDAVTVTVTRATTQALLTHNIQTGRKATLTKQGSTCAFESARFWSIRGAEEANFIPNPTRDSQDSVVQVEARLPLPAAGKTSGAVDTENDGQLGVAFQVAGILTGTRNSVQRDWTKWFTETGYTIPAATNWTQDVVIRADFDNQENVLNPTSGLLVQGSMPKQASKHVLKLRFLGRDHSDPRVTAIVKASDIETCYAIQDAMPAEQLE